MRHKKSRHRDLQTDRAIGERGERTASEGGRGEGTEGRVERKRKNTLDKWEER